MKSRSSTQRPGPNATHARSRACYVSAQQSGITPSLSASCRQTSMPGVRLHPALTPVRSEIELVNASSILSTQWLGPSSTHGRGRPCSNLMCSLSSQVLALACQPHADGLACPGIVFTPFPLLCALWSNASMHRAPWLAWRTCSCHRRLSHYHLQHQAAQVTSYLLVPMVWCAVRTFIVLSMLWSTHTCTCLNLPASKGTPGTVMSNILAYILGWCSIL